MEDNNTGVLVALLGIGIAAVMFLAGGSGPSSSGAVTRNDAMESFAANQQSLFNQMQEIASSSSSSSSSSPAPGEPGFAQQVVERTGYLPSGFDAAGRVAQISQPDFQEDYQVGDGTVGL